jgi:RNA polymerase-binding protein DksA
MAAQNSPATKAAAGRSKKPAGKAVASTSPARKTSAKTTAKKSGAKPATSKTTAKPATSKTTTAGARASTRSTPSKQAPAKKTTAKKTTANKTTAKKTTANKIPAKKTPAKKTPAKKTPAKKTAAKKAPANKTSAKKTSGSAKTSAPVKEAGQARARKSAITLAVRTGERPWTAQEIAEVRALLQSDEDRLEIEISAVEEEIGHLLREGGEGAGHDQADVGSNTFERDHEMSMARNARDNLVLVKEAIARIDDGTYGVCESCGRPIGKMRLQAFPRATLCMECKQRQERR